MIFTGFQDPWSICLEVILGNRQTVIRHAEPADAGKLTLLARRSKASWGYPESWLREWQSQLSFSAAYLRRHPVFVASNAAEIVGVIALEDGVEPELAHLWIDPVWQGQGLGRQLVRRALDAAGEIGWESLRIESDPHAQSFYERLGAIRIGEVKAPVAGTQRLLPVLRLLVKP